jgi:hypothetical protein
LYFRERRAQAKAHYDALDVTWKEAQAMASEIIPPGKSTLGGIEISRTIVEGRTTFKYALAVKAGAVDPAAVSEFVTVGQPHERWTITARPEWQEDL